MNYRCNDRELLAASQDIDRCLNTLFLITVNFKSLEENEQFQSDYAEEYGGRWTEEAAEFYAGHDKDICDGIQKGIERAKETFPSVISVIRNHLHLFASASSDVVDLQVKPFTEHRLNQYGFEYMEPKNIIGTSAHHAGILYLESALFSEFWSGEESEANISDHVQVPFINYNLLEARLERERLLVFEPGLRVKDDENQETYFDDVECRFFSKGISATFKPIDYSLFKCVYNNGRASYDLLRDNVQSWKRNGATNGAIEQAKGRVNKALSQAGLLGEYELSQRNQHILFRKDIESETTD